jgi:hypothetical protein
LCGYGLQVGEDDFGGWFWFFLVWFFGFGWFCGVGFGFGVGVGGGLGFAAGAGFVAEFFEEALGEAFAFFWRDDFGDGGEGAVDGVVVDGFDLVDLLGGLGGAEFAG